jgi:hypothetical protein
MALFNNNWFNLNSTRRYPIDDSATGESDTGVDFPNDIIVDIRLRFPDSLCSYCSLSGINISKSIVTVTIIGHSRHPGVGSSSSSYGDQGFYPVAVISLPKPVIPGIPYRLSNFSNGVSGWIVFGEGVENNLSARFSDASQSLISVKAARAYRASPVKSIGILNSSVFLTGDVLLKSSGDLSVTIENRTINGVGVRKCVVFSLTSEGSLDNLYKKYLGKCEIRPESESCNKISVEYINDIPPDCNGNITLSFSGNGLVGQRIINNSDILGMALELPLGMAEACTKNDYLPDNDGKLPNEYVDECADIAAAEGDQDSITNCNNTNLHNSMSSSSLSSTTLPYLDTLIAEIGSASPPSHFEFINSKYERITTPHDREFPLNSSRYKGLSVLTSGSRFLAIWNDSACSDHLFAKDILNSNDNGIRASVSLTFLDSITSGAAGVIVDYATIYSDNYSAYISTYIIGVLDFPARRIKLYRWLGHSWLLVGQSDIINSLKIGSWYSLDLQKANEGNQNNYGTRRYTLKLYESYRYWLDYNAPNSPVHSPPHGTPANGYWGEPMSAYLLETLDVYTDAYSVTDGVAGFGTIGNSKVAFSYFFVG